MSNEVRAHIFGRSRRGDREEVKMKLYNVDGTEFVPGSTVTGLTLHGQGAPSASIGQDNDWYIDLDTGVTYGPKAADTWPPPLITPGASSNPLDVVPANLDVSSPWPQYTVDCDGRSLVHIRKLIVPSSVTENKAITINLQNLAIGTPYMITVDNAAPFSHRIEVNVNDTPVFPFVVSGGPKLNNDVLFLPPNQICSIMSLYTGPTERPLAVVTRPGSPAFKRVTGSYILAQDYDANALIFVNSAGPATITLRDLINANEWWEGEEVEIYQEGAGAVTVAGPPGTTITRPGGATGNFVLPARYCSVKLRCVDVGKWVVVNYTPATGM